MTKILFTLVFVLLMGGLSRLSAQHHAEPQSGAVKKAVAVLNPTKGSNVSGLVIFESVAGGIKVTARISGLTPGKHGFHIHEFGDCSSDNGLAAGGHFNPTQMPHSAPASDKRHIGDLGNIEADAQGNATLEYVDPVLQFSGPTGIVGRGMIVHEKEDDLKTQPTGDAGARLACGVIGAAKSD